MSEDIRGRNGFGRDIFEADDFDKDLFESPRGNRETYENRGFEADYFEDDLFNRNENEISEREDLFDDEDERTHHCHEESDDEEDENDDREHHRHHRRRRCKTCVPLRKNCNSRCCEELECECPDINNASCTPILSERIFDCISLEDEQSSFVDCVTFTIDDDHGQFREGERICIDRVGVTYKFIGLKDTHPNVVLVDNTPYLFVPPTGSIFRGCNKPLFDEAEATVVTGKFCCDRDDRPGVKTRIVEKDLEFFACELKITVVGRIGCRKFVAVKDFDRSSHHHEDEDENIANCPVKCPKVVSLDDLGFKPITFVGRMCLPAGPRKSTVHEEFDVCLSADCVTPICENFVRDDRCDGRSRFKASVEFSLLIRKSIFSTIREKLAVFTTPAGVRCHNGSLDNSCREKCED